MTQGALVSIVLPVFCFIGLGYVLITTRLLNERVGDALADFVFTVAIPVLLFRAIGTLDVPDLNPWPYWLSYFGGVAVNIAFAILIITKVFGRDARAGVIAAMSASFSNIVMVGMPVVTVAFGDRGLVTVLLLIAVHLPVMMTLSQIMVEVVDARHEPGRRFSLLRTLRRVVLGLIRNPLVVAILCGVLFRFTGLPVAGIAKTVIDKVADTAIPLALMALGMSLHKYGVRGNVLPAVAIGAVKLVTMPVVIFVFAHVVFGLPDLAVAVAVTCAACPTGANAYLIATRFDTGLALSANTITLTTALSVVSLGLWLSLFVG